MSLQDSPRYSLEELQEIADKASRVIPRYREQNIALKAALEEKELELEQCKKLLIAKQKEADEYKTLYEKTEKSNNFYKTENTEQRKVLNRTFLAFGFVLLVVISLFLTNSNKQPVNDLQIKPTATVGASRSLKLRPVDSFSASSGSVSQPQKEEIYVWIPNSGKRYHDSERCSGMKSPKYVSLSEAKRRGYTPCGNCDPPR